MRAAYSPEAVARARSPGSVHVRCAPLRMYVSWSAGRAAPAAVHRFSSSTAVATATGVCVAASTV